MKIIPSPNKGGYLLVAIDRPKGPPLTLRCQRGASLSKIAAAIRAIALATTTTPQEQLEEARQALADADLLDGRARRRKSPERRQTAMLQIRLTPTERDQVIAAARAAGLPMSEWVLDRLRPDMAT